MGEKPLGCPYFPCPSNSLVPSVGVLMGGWGCHSAEGSRAQLPEHHCGSRALKYGAVALTLLPPHPQPWSVWRQGAGRGVCQGQHRLGKWDSASSSWSPLWANVLGFSPSREGDHRALRYRCMCLASHVRLLEELAMSTYTEPPLSCCVGWYEVVHAGHMVWLILGVHVLTPLHVNCAVVMVVLHYCWGAVLGTVYCKHSHNLNPPLGLYWWSLTLPQKLFPCQKGLQQ